MSNKEKDKMKRLFNVNEEIINRKFMHFNIKCNKKALCLHESGWKEIKLHSINVVYNVGCYSK